MDRKNINQKRYFSIVSLGRNRWYWVVWPSLEEIHASVEPLLHIAEGYEKTKAEAVERALGLAGRNAAWMAAKYARIDHHARTSVKGGKIHSSNADPAHIPTLHNFLYREVYDPQRKQWISEPHRIVRRTKNFVFVEQKPYTPDELTGSWVDGESPTFRLDRKALAQDGYAFIPATAEVADTEQPIFFDHKRVEDGGRVDYQCLQVLKLTWPCTVSEVKGAYRQLVKNAHPDGGGSQDTFLALQEAYEHALDLCARNADPTQSLEKRAAEHH